MRSTRMGFSWTTDEVVFRLRTSVLDRRQVRPHLVSNLVSMNLLSNSCQQTGKKSENGEKTGPPTNPDTAPPQKFLLPCRRNARKNISVTVSVRVSATVRVSLVLLFCITVSSLVWFKFDSEVEQYRTVRCRHSRRKFTPPRVRWRKSVKEFISPRIRSRWVQRSLYLQLQVFGQKKSKWNRNRIDYLKNRIEMELRKTTIVASLIIDHAFSCANWRKWFSLGQSFLVCLFCKFCTVCCVCVCVFLYL